MFLLFAAPECWQSGALVSCLAATEICLCEPGRAAWFASIGASGSARQQLQSAPVRDDRFVQPISGGLDPLIDTSLVSGVQGDLGLVHPTGRRFDVVGDSRVHQAPFVRRMWLAVAASLMVRGLASTRLVEFFDL